MKHPNLEAEATPARNAATVAEARQRAALKLACGIDIDWSSDTQGADMQRARQLVERALRRERAKGLRRHWSYDLNRHIALKRALDRLVVTSMS